MNLGSVLVVIIFMVGFFLHVLKVANDDIQKTLFPNMLAWFKVFWPNVVVRMGIAVVIWIVYFTSPEMLIKALQHFGVNFNNSLPVTKCTSFIAGFFADSLLDLGTKKIPYLGRMIPPAYIAAEVREQNQKAKDGKDAGN